MTPTNTVNTIAELRQAPTSADAALLVLGYYTPGDGGGGIFRADPNSIESANGGTIIKPDSPLTGCWKRVYDGPLSVKWFGAKGDCASNPLAQAAYPTLTSLAPTPTDEIDWAAIQAALYACIAAGGGEVCFPEGVYKVNRKLSATFATNAHITLRGMKHAVLDMTTVPNNAVQTLLMVGGVHLQQTNLSSDATKGAHTIEFNTVNLAVSPGDVLLITSPEFWEPSVQRPKGEMVEVERVDSSTTVTLRSPLFDSYGATTTVQKLATPTVRIADIEIKGNGPHLGLVVQYARDVEVKGCRCSGAHYAAFQLNYVFGGMFANNFATDFFDPNQSVGAPAKGVNYGLAIDSCQYITTIGNRLFGGRHALKHGGNEPVRCVVHTGNTLDSEHNSALAKPCLDVHANAEFIEVIGNIILNGVASNGRNITISHNLIRSHHQVCIDIRPTQSGDYYRVSNNQLLSDDYYGLWLAAQGNNVTIESVYIGGNVIHVSAEGIHIFAEDFTGLVLNNVELNGNDVITPNGYALHFLATPAKTLQINRLAITSGRYSGHRCFKTETLIRAGHLVMRDVRLVTTSAGGSAVLTSCDFADALIDGCWLESEKHSGTLNELEVSGDMKWINNVVKNFTEKSGLQLTAATLTFQNNTHYNCHGSLNVSGSGKVQSPTLAAGKVRTMDKTKTPVWTYTMSDNTVAEVVASVLAHERNGNSATYKRRASVKRRQGGPATVIKTVDVIGIDKADVAGREVFIETDVNDVRVLVKGDDTPIVWMADVEVTLFKT